MVQVTQIYMVAPTSAKHLPVPSLPAASSTNHGAPRLPLLYTYSNIATPLPPLHSIYWCHPRQGGRVW